MKAQKALLNIKRIQPDDIGHLRRIKATELSTEVKCHNHAHSVALKKQIDQWFKEQQISVNKLSREQQKVFRKLIIVQNEKRKIQRREHIQKQREIQQKLREQAARDRDMARRKSIQLTNALKKRKVERSRTKENKDDHKESTRENSSISARSRPKVYFTSKKNLRDKLPSINVNLTRDNDSGLGESLSNSEQFVESSVSHRLTPDTGIIDLVSHINAIPVPDWHDTSRNFDSILPRKKSEFHLAETSVDFVKEVGKAVLPDIPSNTNSLEKNVDTSVTAMENKIESFSILPPISSDSIPVSKAPNTIADSSNISTSSLSYTTANSSLKHKKSVSTKDSFHVGIPHRQFKLPDYTAPVVTTVTKYRKGSDGSYVCSNVKVKPAIKDFQLPSMRRHYVTSRALLWEKEKEPARKKKMDEFIGKQKDFEIDAKPKEEESKSQEPFQKQYPKAGSSYLTLTSSIHRQAMLGLLKDATDMNNCRYLRFYPDKADTDEPTDEEKVSFVRSTPSKKEKASSWGKFSSTSVAPSKKNDFYYVSMR